MVTDLHSKVTWMDADEAKELGFATQVVAEIRAKAKFDLMRAELPAHVAAMFKGRPISNFSSVTQPVPIVPDGAALWKEFRARKAAEIDGAEWDEDTPRTGALVGATVRK